MELFSPQIDDPCTPNPNQPRKASLKVATELSPSGPFCLTSEDSTLFIAGQGGDIEQWQIKGQQPQRTDKRHAWNADRQDGSQATAMTCAADGRWVALGDTSGQITVLEFGNGPSTLRSFDRGKERIEDKKQDAGVAALLNWDSRDMLIALFQQGPIGLLQRNGADLVYLYPNANGDMQLKCAAIQRGDKSQAKPHPPHAAFDPETGQLGVGIDGSIGLWDLSALSTDAEVAKPTGTELPGKVYAPYTGFKEELDSVTALAFIQAENSKTAVRSIAAADELLNMRIFLKDGLEIDDKQFDQKSLIKLACQSVKRNLSWQEWTTHVGEDINYECTCPDHPPGIEISPEVLAKAINCKRNN